MIASILFAASVAATPAPPLRTWEADAKECTGYVCGCPVGDNPCTRFILAEECLGLLIRDPKLPADQYSAAARVCLAINREPQSPVKP